MIISGNSAASWRNFAKHLMKTEDGRQIVTLKEIRGLAGDTVMEAFRELAMLGEGVRSKKFYYHANIDPRADEPMTEEQWEQAVDLLEENLGLDGQERFIVEHEKNGRVHRHVIWSRVDTDSMTVVRDSHNYLTHMRTADQLEELFGHERTPRGRGPDGPNPKNYEVRRGKESGIAPKDVGAELTRLWRTTDTGKALAAAIEDQGFILARGDSRGYVVLDAAGDVHSLAKRVAGARTKDINARMKDVPLASLPSVDEARKTARQRAAERSADAEAALPDPAPAFEAHHADPQKQRLSEAQGRESSTAPDKADPTRSPFPAQGEVITSLDQFAEASRRSMDANIRRTQTQLVSNLDEFADAMTAAMQANGGEPFGGDGLSFWQRNLLFIQEAPGRIAAWVKDAFESFVERLTLNRQSERDSPESGMER